MITLPNNIIVKQTNQDFLVNEISLLPKDVSATDTSLPVTLLTVTKSGYTTFEAMRLIGEILNANQEIHCEGLKDEDGVTEQIMSVPSARLSSVSTDTLNDKLALTADKWIHVAIRGYANEHVKEKHLHGNIFSLTLRNLTQKHADRITDFCKDAQDQIFINYYDQQRFGLPGGPFFAHKIGEAISRDDWATANKQYILSGNAVLDGIDPHDPDAIHKVHTGKLKFFLAAQTSLLWNEAVSSLVSSNRTLDIFEGHTVRIPTNSAKLTIPPIVDVMGYSLGQDSAVYKKSKSRATYVSTTIYCQAPKSDEYHDQMLSMTVSFQLPTGSFATMIAKQLCALTA